MNILVYDDPPAIGHFIRSALAGRAHRASIAASVDDAILKLDTGLFDAAFLGANGAPRELAEHLENEWPALPLVLAGVEIEVACEDPIVAVLARPMRFSAIEKCLLTLERRLAGERAARYDMPIDILLGERRLAFRVLKRTKDSVLLERAPSEVLPDEWNAISRCDTLSLIRGVDASAVTAPAHILFADGSSRGDVRLLGMHIDDPALAEQLTAAAPQEAPRAEG